MNFGIITVWRLITAQCFGTFPGLHNRTKWEACGIWNWRNLQFLCRYVKQFKSLGCHEEFYFIFLFPISFSFIWYDKSISFNVLFLYLFYCVFIFIILDIDPANASIITQCGGIPLVIQCLSSPVTNIVSSCVITG